MNETLNPRNPFGTSKRVWGQVALPPLLLVNNY